jgi:hypothetical protein
VVVTWRLSEAAQVTLTVHRALGGRRVGRRCLAPRRSRRSRPLCTRYVRAGTRTVIAGVASNEVTLPARLTRGARHHRVRLLAVDAAGNESKTRSARL